jgi:CRP-like cAMP-binding protein
MYTRYREEEMSMQEASEIETPRTLQGITPERPLNTLLRSLPARDYDRLAPHLQRVPMVANQVLFRQDAPVDRVYFPGGGACSLVKHTEDGQTAEVAMVGREGAIGGCLAFGLEYSPCDVIVQIAGPYADVLDVDVFKRELEARGALYAGVATYCQALLLMLMQSTACNSLHSAEKRLVRWLLMTHDRSGRDQFRFTHEHVASMLGLRRPTVTIVAGKLQAARLIECRRGTVTIHDRPGLEVAACECYRTVRRTFERLVADSRDSRVELQAQ